MWMIVLRTVFIYLVLMLLLRLLGKRQLGEMELSEFVVAALIANLAAHPLQEHDTPLLTAVVPIASLAAMELLTAWISMRSIRLRSLFYGRPSLIVDHGKLNQEEMRKNRFTGDELMQAMRSQGILDINEVPYAVLETNGTLNVIPIAEAQPVTAGQMGLAKEQAGYPTIVISGGRVLEQNLTQLGFDRRWLARRLKERGLGDPARVFLMTADENGNVFFCEKKDE